ncbi:unnamed protein product [Jaminaea pallidilutea]
MVQDLERGSRNRCPSSSLLHFFPFDSDLEKDRAIANTMSSGQSERTPLLHGRSPSGLASSQPPGQILGDRADTEGPFDDEELAQESHFSAIQDAQNTVDAQASAFLPEGSYFSVHQATGGHQSQLAAVEEAATPSAPERSKSEVILILAALWIGTFLAAADGSIVATILASVGSEFKASKEVDWIGTSYLLSTCSFQPLYGRGADIFGRKTATLFASTVFGLGCLLCGLSQTFTQLCIARAVAGIGGGGLTTMSTIVTSDLVSLKDRGTYQGLGNLVFAAGSALGAPLGGLLADGRLGWRFAFLVQVPICVVHFVAVSVKVDIPGGPGSMAEKLKRIDVFGALSLVSAVVLVLIALTLGGNQRPWSDVVVWGSLLAGLCLLAVFVAVEKYVAREPLMPMTVLFRRTPGFVALSCWFISMSQFGVIFNVPGYFQAVEETTSSYAGLHLIPNAIIASTCSLASGLVIGKTGKYKKMLLVGGFCGLLGPVMMAFWQKGTTPSWAYWLTMPFPGAAYGSILTITLVALIASVQPHEMAAATGVTYLWRATGSVLGISLSSAILRNRLQVNLERAGFPEKLVSAIRQDVTLVKALDPLEKRAAIDAMQHSFRAVFIAIAVAGGLAFLLLWPIPEHDLPGSKKESQAAAARSSAEEDE